MSDHKHGHWLCSECENEIAHLRAEVERLKKLCDEPFDADRVESVVLTAVGPVSARTFRRILQNLKRERDEAVRLAEDFKRKLQRAEAVVEAASKGCRQAADSYGGPVNLKPLNEALAAWEEGVR